MTQYVLSAGNCGFDNSQLSQLLQDAAGTAVRTADSIDEAVDAVDDDCRLVLVNRVFDRTGEQGLELIGRLRDERPQAAIMLISNFPDAQQSAEAAGALPGFGKSQLSDPALAKRLAELLNRQEPTS